MWQCWIMLFLSDWLLWISQSLSPPRVTDVVSAFAHLVFTVRVRMWGRVMMNG